MLKVCVLKNTRSAVKIMSLLTHYQIVLDTMIIVANVS